MHGKNCIYLADTHEITDRRMFEELFRLIPPERQEKVSRFLRDEDKYLSLCAGLLLEEGIRQLGLSAEPTLAVTDKGKPYFYDLPGVFFNLSHSGHFAVCVFSDRQVGVDMECIRCFDDRLAEFVFHGDEIGRVREEAGDTACDALYTRLWTMKESIMKYYGEGLALEPKDIHIGRGGQIIGVKGHPDARHLHISGISTAETELSVCSEYEVFPGEQKKVCLRGLLSGKKRG